MFNSIAVVIARKNLALERHRKVVDTTVKPIVRPNGDDKGREEAKKRGERRIRVVSMTPIDRLIRANRPQNPNGDDREK